MNKIAVFGKPGSGKSILSKRLASATGIKLHALDSVLYKQDGGLVDRKTYDEEHESILSSDSWIYIDLPYFVSYWLVTKRLLKGLVVKPEGWPAGSSIVKGTVQSYKMLRLCPKFWNDGFVQKLEEVTANKSLYVIRSVSQLNGFADKNIRGFK